MGKVKMDRESLLRAAHQQLDMLFVAQFPENTSELTLLNTTIETAYSTPSLSVVRIIWDIALEDKTDDDILDIDFEKEAQKVELRKKQKETMIKILEDKGYHLGKVEYSEGYQIPIMVDAVIYPNNSNDGYNYGEEYDIYGEKERLLSLDEQWEKAWKHYCSQ